MGGWTLGWAGSGVGVGFEGVADGLGDEAADGAFLAELHLAFGGMDVHVHGGGVDVEEEAADGEAAFHEGGVVAFEEGMVEAAVLDGAAIDEEVLLVAGRAGNAGCADEAPQVEVAEGILAEDPGCLGVGCGLDLGGEVDGKPWGRATVEGAEAVVEGLEALGHGVSGTSREFPHKATFVDEGKPDAGMGEGGEGEVVLDVGSLGFLGAEELAACGQVEEEGADLDGGAGGEWRRP